MTPHGHVLAQVHSILAQAGIHNPSGDALAIVSAASRLSDTTTHAMCALAMAAERAAGTPLAHVTGWVQFMDIELLAAPGVLVPREETELLGRTAVHVLNTMPSAGEARAIDMCCGSGNLACGIASHHPGVRVWASDLAADAVRVAGANVRRLGLSDRVEVVQSDLFAALGGRGLEGTIDLVVCNPPYISSTKLKRESAALLVHEPRTAFDGGPYGVRIFQRVVREALAFLRPGGTLLFEIGEGQERQVALLFERNGCYEPALAIKDSQGRARVMAGQKQRASA